MEAIHAFKGKAVSYPAIRKQVLAMYPDATNENALRLALKNGVPRGAFAKEKASYVLTAASRRHMASVDAARKASAPKKVEAPQTFETEYERQRAENVSRNREMLAMLGLASSAQPAPQAKKVAAVGRFQPPKAGERASRRTNSEASLAAISKARRPKPKRAAVRPWPRRRRRSPRASGSRAMPATSGGAWRRHRRRARGGSARCSRT